MSTDFSNYEGFRYLGFLVLWFGYLVFGFKQLLVQQVVTKTSSQVSNFVVSASFSSVFV